VKAIGIIGSRHRDSVADYKLVESKFFELYEEGDWIVSGGCPTGGDKFAKEIHQRYKIPYLEFPANWDKHGKAAGFVRNTDIAQYSHILIACVAADRTGGTEDTVKKFTDKFFKSKEDIHLV